MMEKNYNATTARSTFQDDMTTARTFQDLYNAIIQYLETRFMQNYGGEFSVTGGTLQIKFDASDNKIELIGNPDQPTWVIKSTQLINIRLSTIDYKNFIKQYADNDNWVMKKTLSSLEELLCDYFTVAE